MTFHYVKFIDTNGETRVTIPMYDGIPCGLPRKRWFFLDGSIVSGLKGAMSMWNGDLNRLPWCQEVVEHHTKRGETLLWKRSKKALYK